MSPRQEKFEEMIYFTIYFRICGVLEHQYLGFYTPPTDAKLAPKCLFFQVFRYDIELFMGGAEKKNLKIKIYPTCFEKVFFRKNSLSGTSYLAYPLWYWRTNRLEIF